MFQKEINEGIYTALWNLIPTTGIWAHGQAGELDASDKGALPPFRPLGKTLSTPEFNNWA